jgi:SAM-dependent methyltransferase
MRARPKLSSFVYSVFGYTNLGNWARAKVYKQIIKILPLENFKKVMDLGAGYGEYSFMLSEALPAAEITALEILPERIEALHRSIAVGKFKNITVFGDKIGAMPGKEIYDFIFAVDVFEHIYKEHMPFDDCFEKLKAGGFLLVKIPNITQKTIFPDSWFQEHKEWLDDEHVGQVYDLEGLVQRFKGAGFEIVHQSYSDGWFSRLGWETAYLSRKGGSLIQLAFLPVAKLLVNIDRVVYRSKTFGNAIQVIGRKPAAK